MSWYGPRLIAVISLLGSMRFGLSVKAFKNVKKQSSGIKITELFGPIMNTFWQYKRLKQYHNTLRVFIEYIIVDS